MCRMFSYQLYLMWYEGQITHTLKHIQMNQKRSTFKPFRSQSAPFGTQSVPFRSQKCVPERSVYNACRCVQALRSQSVPFINR